MSGSEIKRRRICWPNPDATCLEGGCIYCNDHRFRSVRTISRYAYSAGVIRNRGGGEKDAWEAFRYGVRRRFNNADTELW